MRSYIDWLTQVPWKSRSKVKKNLALAEEILNADHYGLDKVKERILEYLAVQQRVNKLKGPILCLVGPPGVGKTSLGQSVAKATGRKYVRMALGGVRDRSSLALTAARMREDPIFRDAAHHFLRTFDRTFSEFEKHASDADLADLADTRTARAFMLLGRVTGTFD